MVSALISRLVILIFGTLYPAYASYKAVKTKNVKEYVKWMMYWIVFALFTCAETFADVLISWLPFYYELKIIFVIWLLSPATNGSSILYRRFVHPELMRHEENIDQYLDKVKTQGYSAFIQVSTQGLHYAIQTAITGQAKIVDHLRKSYSMNDLSRPALAAGRPFLPTEAHIREQDTEEDSVDDVTAVHSQRRPRYREQILPRPEEEEDERYLEERLAEDNEYLATAGGVAQRQHNGAPLSSSSDVNDNRAYNLRSQQLPPLAGSNGGSGVNRRAGSTDAGTAAALQQQQHHQMKAERPYSHDEGYHYGTLPRRRQSKTAAGSRPTLPSEWHS